MSHAATDVMVLSDYLVGLVGPLVNPGVTSCLG